MIDKAAFLKIADLFPKAPENHPSYGTSGFRDVGDTMHSTLFRCGVLIALRSQQLGQATGLMVTASHNPAQDNGVKLAEPSGHMLDQSWEPYADRFANAATSSALYEDVCQVISSEAIQSGSGRVLVGRDSRATSEALVDAASQGIQSVGGVVDKRGLLTTPQLHWMVRELNLGTPNTEQAYYDTLSDAYRELVSGPDESSQVWTVDCANGVGAQKLKPLQNTLAKMELRLENTGSGVLNESCGADFVQKGTAGKPTLPQGFSNTDPSCRCASFDGDADRIVIFRRLGGSEMQLFDGDRIAVLFAALLQKLLTDWPATSNAVTMGVVQTAYANGMSTRYMRENLGLTVLLAKTGVKYVHALAETFDIGIYFEANGHGTILFKASLVESIRTQNTQSARKLLAVHALMNQAAGDAISNLLLVDVALRILGWSMDDWAQLYQDLPSSMLKVKVADRTAFTTTDAETKTVTPTTVQPRLDEAISKYSLGRCFVRPSGTEDVVRVYAEAQTSEQALELANLAAKIVTEEALR